MKEGKKMKRIIKLGKIDFNGCGRKINMVDIEINLKEDKNLSICGNIWNSKKTDILTGGQCCEEINKYFRNNKTFKKIYRLWKLYHLNDMHAGTIKQETFLNENGIKNWASNYEKVCKILEENGLLYDNGIKFGATWQYWEIPGNDLQEIKNLIEKGE